MGQRFDDHDVVRPLRDLIARVYGISFPLDVVRKAVINATLLDPRKRDDARGLIEDPSRPGC